MSDDFVVDAAAAVTALINKNALGIALHKLITESICHAPHLIDAEVGHSLRRRVRNGDVEDETAETDLRALGTLINHRYMHTGWLAADAWQLRHHVTFYDALYVALAARLNFPLLTADRRLSKAHDLPCRVELIE